jgi:hypothetical protein
MTAPTLRVDASCLFHQDRESEHWYFGSTQQPSLPTGCSQRGYEAENGFQRPIEVEKRPTHFQSACRGPSREHQLNYEPTALYFNVDTSQLKISPSQFTIERKVETPFSENTYYSLAPLRSKEHFEFLVEIEGLMR